MTDTALATLLRSATDDPRPDLVADMRQVVVAELATSARADGRTVTGPVAGGDPTVDEPDAAYVATTTTISARTRRGPWLAAAAVLVVLVGLGAFVTSRSGTQQPAGTTEPTFPATSTTLSFETANARRDLVMAGNSLRSTLDTELLYVGRDEELPDGFLSTVPTHRADTDAAVQAFRQALDAARAANVPLGQETFVRALLRLDRLPTLRISIDNAQNPVEVDRQMFQSIIDDLAAAQATLDPDNGWPNGTVPSTTSPLDPPG